MTGIEIRPVESRADRDAFLRLPYRIYADDPAWVAPLLMERAEHISAKNPFLAHAEAAFWLAYKDGEPVGRISAQYDAMHVERHGPQGHFGFLEAVDDPAVFAALLETAESWLKARGAQATIGPASFSVNDEFGLQVGGFETPSMMLMNHARPYYGAHIEAAGYAGIKDLLAYLYDTDLPMAPLAAKLADKVTANPRVTIRGFDMKRLREEIGVVVDIFNDAWADNWGFVPMTTAEVDHMADQLRPLLRPELAWFAEMDGEPVAMIVALPNLHEALAGLDGKLLPFGAAKLLWRLKVKGLKGARVLMMGVRRDLRDRFLSAALAYALIERLRVEGRKVGFRYAELSWVLEDNQAMVKIAEMIAGAPYQRFRLYEKALGQT